MANPDWELETWKAAVSLTEKLFLLVVSTLILPTILRSPFPLVAFAIGAVLAAGSFAAWFSLIIQGRRKKEKKNG